MEPTFVAGAAGIRFEFVAALLAAGDVSDTDAAREPTAAAVFVVVFPAFIFAVVFAAGFTVLFTVLWVGLAIDFVAAGVFLRADWGLDAVLPFFSASLPAAFPPDVVRALAVVLTALRFVTDLLTVAFMVPSLMETPDTLLPGLKPLLSCTCGRTGLYQAVYDVLV